MNACDFLTSWGPAAMPPAVIPILVGPLQALLALLPAIAVALGSVFVSMFKPSVIKRFVQLLWSQKLVAGGIAGAIVALVYLYPIVFPPTVEGGLREAGTTDWPLYRGSLARRGFQPGPNEDPAHGKVVWSFQHDGVKDFYSSPGLVGNRLYIASAGFGPYENRGAICSVNADTGKLVWAYDSGGYLATYSSPSVWGKYLVIGEGLHLTKDARVFCLDVPASEKAHKGVKLWEYRTRSHVESSPCIFDGNKVVVGAGDDGMYCFALEPEGGKPRLLWRLDPNEYADCETSPVAYKGRVYWGLGVGGMAVCCVDGETGQPIWRRETPSPAFGSPTLADGRLFIGMGYGDIVNSADRLAGDLRGKLEREGKSKDEIEAAVGKIKRKGEVWCLDPNDGHTLWKKEVGQAVLGSVAVDGNRAYAAARDGTLYCFAAANGDLIKTFEAHEPFVTSPAVGEDYVYVVTVNGRVCGLDKKRMALVWDVALSAPFSVSSPAVGRGHVYLGTKGRGLLCLGLPGKEAPKPFWAGALGGPGRTGWTDDSLLPVTAEYAWEFAPAEPNQAADAAAPYLSPPAFLDDSFYVGLHQGRKNGLAKIHCWKKDPNLPAQKWLVRPTQKWLAESANPVSLSAAGTEKAVFFVDGRPGDAGRALHCVNPDNGKELWQRAVEPQASGEFVLEKEQVRTADGNIFTRDRLLIASTTGGIACLDVTSPASPKDIWKADIGPTVGPACVVGDIVIVAVPSPAGLAALDLETGEPLWSAPLPSSPQTGPVFAAGRVWAGLSFGLACYSPAHGEPDLVIPCGGVQSLFCDAERLVFRAQDGEWVVVDARAREVVGRIRDAAGSLPPVLTDEAVLYFTADAIKRYDLRSRKSAYWAEVKADEYGTVVTPMIVADSHVVFATDKSGLVCMKPRKQ